MRNYSADICTENEKFDWKQIRTMDVDNFVWEGNGYAPQTSAKLIATESALAIRMESKEADIRAEVANQNGNVFEDSCMEFFLQPSPDMDRRYFNFEINSRGVLLLAVGEKQEGRKQLLVDRYVEYFSIQAKVVPQYGWSITYRIPYAFIRQEFPGFIPYRPIKANFFKCGNLCRRPHYGCWNKIDSELWSFHRPEFFGTIVFADKI